MNGYTRGLSEKKQTIQENAGVKILLIKDCKKCEWVYKWSDWKRKQAIKEHAGCKRFIIKA